MRTLHGQQADGAAWYEHGVAQSSLHARMASCSRPGGLGARLRMRPGQRLEHVMMRVDEAGEDDMPAGVENRVDGCLRFGASAYTFSNPAVFHDQSALGALGENGDRVLDPASHVVL